MEQPLINEATAATIAEHHFQKKPIKITKMSGGLANFVYEAEMDDGSVYIIRMSDVGSKINYFLKEQWAVRQAKERGVPVPEILEVGNEAVQNPYMIVKKVQGIEATKHPDRLKILQQMGKYGAVINTIPTSGFGHVFDWSNNTLSKRETWRDFLEKELTIPERLAMFEENEILTPEHIERLNRHLNEIAKWDKSPTLNHSDLRLKNVLVDDAGKIIAILDWENCTSNIAPYWELSIALHDLNMDECQAFLEGYGVREKDFKDLAPAIKAFNIINYAPYIGFMLEKKDVKGVERYKLRLNGYLDLFSFDN
jgi:hygromycin-B 4-O-kinase